MLQTIEIVGLMLVDFAVGVGVGWCAKTWLASSQRAAAAAPPVVPSEANDTPSTEDAQGAASDSQQCLDTLSGLSDEMDGHASALQSFSAALVAGRGEEEVDTMREANRRFNDQMTDKMASLLGLNKVQQNGLKELLNNLGSYQGQVGSFCQQLENPDKKLAQPEVQHMLASCVQELLDTKQQLAADLHSARREIEEHKARLERARSEARADVLTGLPNRRAFEEKLRELDALNEGYVVAMFDADRFKQLNDTYGHATGDAALGMLGKVLRKGRRIGDHIYRYGGEEFALIIPNTELNNGGRVADKLRKRVEAASLRSAGEVLKITISGGAAERAGDEIAIQVVQRADAALYASKQAGGNSIYLHEGGDSARPFETTAPQDKQLATAGA